MAEQRYDIEILDPAQSELEDIGLLYLSLSGAKTAKKITDGIYDAIEQLQQFPLSGPPVRDAELRALGYRFTVSDKYIVIYRVIGRSVVVYHVFDGRSDYPTLFKTELFG